MLVSHFSTRAYGRTDKASYICFCVCSRVCSRVCSVFAPTFALAFALTVALEISLTFTFALAFALALATALAFILALALTFAFASALVFAPVFALALSCSRFCSSLCFRSRFHFPSCSHSLNIFHVCDGSWCVNLGWMPLSISPQQYCDPASLVTRYNRVWSHLLRTLHPVFLSVRRSFSPPFAF